ncbi:uncharacterized protein LOC119010202 [Acanthopagrus latus]|uniref:uncharacterized protein LOC119010202 n=1 Tax=Acanthopagrus latus TaxID=8177 RepID=UPI00187CCF6D|nr:uncharacterized protein LOC119010202 [Acanthopagrus latus]
MANRDSNKLLAASFQEDETVNFTTLQALLRHMVGQVEEMKSQQVAQQLVVNQTAEDLRSLKETLQKYPDPDQLREELRSLRETLEKFPDPDQLREKLSSVMETLQKCPDPGQCKEEQDETPSLVEIENKIKFLFHLHERLHEEVKRLVCKEMVRDTENVEAMSSVQNAILQLQRKGQSNFDKLNEDTQNLAGKVSHLQSDFVSKLSKLTIQVDSKVARADVDSILKEHERPQEADDAAGLSDKPVLKHMPRPPWMQKPSYPRFPPVKTTGQPSSFTVPAPEQCNRNQDAKTLSHIHESGSGSG